VKTICASRFRRPLQAGAAVVLLAPVACAQLPPTAEIAIPPIPPGEARVWFYREYEPYVNLERPFIRMNETIVATSEPGGASYRDVPAGQYHITVESYGTDFNQSKQVYLYPGQGLYVKIVSLQNWVGTNWRGFQRETNYVWLVPPEIARIDVARSPFYGGG